MEDSLILKRSSGRSLELTMNRPNMANAIDVELATALLGAVREGVADNNVKVIVLRGAGKAFMAGGDLGAFFTNLDEAPRTATAIIEPMNQVIDLLVSSGKATVGVLHGAVAGAGMSLASACDFVLALDSTVFCSAYSKVGTCMDVGGSWFLPRALGLRRALEVALLADTLTADDAKKIGLVNWVVSETELNGALAALIDRLSSVSSSAYAATKKLMYSSFGHDLQNQLAEEMHAFSVCAAEPDFREGVSAFMQRRRPVFL